MPRHALVTGASAGLGRELVRQLVRDRGMMVLATARRLDRLDALAGELPEGRVLVEAGDLADPDFRDHLWRRAEALSGGLDLLVNNAGLGHYAEFADQDPAIVRRIVEVNLMALLDLTQKAIRHMKARGSGADPGNLVDPRYDRAAVRCGLCGDQACGPRPSQEPALRAARDGRAGLGRLPGPDRERVLAGGDGE
jgi:NAD(P)-dependent dehydrogenase (short-subunit alcohol dehydrogenase family)